MDDTLAFLFRHGEVVLLVYVFADQVGLPLPAVPVLLAAGGLAAAGQLDLPVAVALSVVASLAADLLWYVAGRARGSGVLGLLCRLSLEPDSCVRQTENVFLRYGVRSLLVAKFVPGLSTVAPPLAGVVGVGVGRFVLYSLGAALLWVSAWMGIGYVVGDALERVVAGVDDLGATVAAILAAVIVAYVVLKWAQRRRFLRGLRAARIGADELKRKLDAGEAIVVVDLRTSLDVERDPYVIPGARRLTPEELDRTAADLARAHEIVLYCS